ncbi:MAG: TipAS antibiotic-recognition domain-containing protein, partial [Actinomycetota bacterium]|nr:TipAS antibiotic-recognition domain-containing protein [Actinomycetota bacterium]
MAATDAQAWKVGQLAASTGLTVRTLHHYDHLGLVRPSQRTAAGYRLYLESDVERLYEVLALRQLGLPLDVIGEVRDGASSIEALLVQHRDYLDRQLVALRTLRAQLTTMVAASQGGEVGSETDFLELIRKVITVDNTVKQYFSEEQLADLAERRAQLGEQAIADVQAAWPKLLGQVQTAVDAGVDPASPEAQKLAADWMGLLEQFHGGDEGLRGSLHRMYAENAQQIEQQ